MIRSLLNRMLGAFERRWNYDATYLKRIAAAFPSAAIRLQLAQHPKPPANLMPLEIYHTARLAAVLHEDCGPCTQLMLDMALDDGVPEHVLKALIEGRPQDAGPEIAMVWDYVAGVSRGENAGDLAGRIAERWTERGLVVLLLAASEARTYPFLKRGLGLARECTRLKVGNAQVAVSNTLDSASSSAAFGSKCHQA